MSMTADDIDGLMVRVEASVSEVRRLTRQRIESLEGENATLRGQATETVDAGIVAIDKGLNRTYDPKCLELGNYLLEHSPECECYLSLSLARDIQATANPYLPPKVI